jgi:hypothetical protein
MPVVFYQDTLVDQMTTKYPAHVYDNSRGGQDRDELNSLHMPARQSEFHGRDKLRIISCLVSDLNMV